MTLPNFVLIGARKSGCTSLEAYLGEHPDVFMCPATGKGFFSDTEERRPVEGYAALFRDVRDEHAIGEASPGYLRSTTAAERVRQLVPHARLIVLLRDPVERAVSDYRMQTRGDSGGRESRSVREAFTPDAPFIQESLYFPQLERYYDRFPREQIRVYRAEDLFSDAAPVVADAFRLLGVDDSFVPNLAVSHNVGWEPRSKLVHTIYKNETLRRAAPLIPGRARRLIRRTVRRHNNGAPLSAVPDGVRREMADLYREDMERVRELTGQDLSVRLDASGG